MWKTVLTVLEAILLAHMIETGQADVTIHVKDRDIYNFRNIMITQSRFQGFHTCLCAGKNSCSVSYSPDDTDGNFETPDDSDSRDVLASKYYNCSTSSRNRLFTCQILDLLPTQLQIPLPPDSHIQTYRLENSTCPSTCVGFVWKNENENIAFPADDQLDIDICDATCLCSVQLTGQSSATTVASLSTSPTTPSPTTLSPTTTGQSTLSTKTSTRVTATLSTTNASFPLKQSRSTSGSKNSGEDAPIGIIVGAVVGVIAVIVIIIIIVVIWRKRRTKAKSSGHADHKTSATSSNSAGVNGDTNDGKSHSYYNSEFSTNSGEVQTANTSTNIINGYHNTLHQPNIIKNGVTPVKHPPKPQFAIKDNDTDFGYSTAQLVIPEDNNNTKGKKSHDNYDYVSVEDDVGVTELNSETTRGEIPVVTPPKEKDDYAVVDKTRKTDLDQDFDYECSRASDGYSTAGNVNQPNLINDDPNATSVYSKLHQEVRDIKNPYNVGPNTNDVYSKLHEEVRDIKNPYNVLPEQQGASDTNSALPNTAHNAHDTKAAKPSQSLPYGKEDYAVVVKTKSTNKPTQASFQLRNDEN